MTQENQSYLRFSLEESVWFQKGQEVEELYSISLDPNVTLTEDDHYVYIRGTLDLSGEYKNDEDNEEEDYSNIFFPKSVQNVERHPNGIYEFVHRFPVDITIPSSRIASLDDIEVSIQTFDYVLPERNSLKLQADLIISGIYSENYQEPLEDENESELNEGFIIADETRVEHMNDEAVEVEISDVLNQLDDLVEKAEDLANELDLEAEASEISNQRTEDEVEFEDHYEDDYDFDDYAEAKLNDNEADEQTISSEVFAESPVKNSTTLPPIPDFQPAFRKSEENKGELFEPFIVEAKRIPKIEELEDVSKIDIPVSKYETEKQIQPIERENEPLLAEKAEKEPEYIESFFAENKEKVTKEREDVSLLHLVQKSRRPAVPDENREQKQDTKQEEKTGKLSESISIADFFSRKQEEDHVRVKVCIVQKGETLDDLAERYSISVQTLLQSNELQPNQDIYEGQVLYIRESHTYKN